MQDLIASAGRLPLIIINYDGQIAEILGGGHHRTFPNGPFIMTCRFHQFLDGWHFCVSEILTVLILGVEKNYTDRKLT